MAKTSILTIMIQLAKKGDGDKAAIKELSTLQSTLKSAGVIFGTFTAVAATAAAVLGVFAKAAMESERVDAKLDAVLKSTNATAGMTRNSLDGLADSLSRVSGVDDELLKNSEAVMLTFTQVGSQVFPDAMSAAMDMSAVMGGDLQSSVVQLGKALNVTAGDTSAATTGMSALRRQGVAFTEDQKKMAVEMVKTGDVMGYQKLVLAELNREFGGASEAMGDTASGSANKLKTALGNLAEYLGSTMLPAIKETNEATADYINTSLDAAKAKDTEAAALQVQFDLGRQVVDQYWEGYTGVSTYSQAVMAAGAELLKLGADENVLLDARRKRAEFDSQSAAMTDDIIAEQDIYQAQLGQLKDILSGDLGRAQDDYNAKLAEYNKQLAEARTQKEKDEINANIAAETDAYNERAQAIIFNIQQEAILDSSIPNDAKLQMVTALGVAYGQYDQATAHAIISNQNLVAQVEAGNMSWERAVALMQASAQGVQENTGSMQSEAEAINYLGQHAENSITKLEAMEAAQAGLGSGIQHEALPAVSSLNKQITSLPPSGTAWSYAFDISVSGSVPVLPKRGSYVGKGHGYENNAGVDSEFASGGQMQFGAGWTMVGEEGFELISPSGYVFSNAESRALMASGMLPEYERKAAGPVGENSGDWGYYSGEGPVVQAARRKKRSGSSPPTMSGSNQSSDQSTAEVVAPLAASTEAAVQSAAVAQQQQVAEGIQTRNVIAQGNTDIADKLSETNDLLRNLNNTLPRSIGAAFQQANP